MPRRAGPRHILDRGSWSYRYKDEYGVWWWRCICSQLCWDHLQYRSHRSLRRHQTSQGTAFCQVDPSFIPPVHEITVEVGHGVVPGPVPAQASPSQQAPLHHEVNPPVVPNVPEGAWEHPGDLGDLQDDPAVFDQGLFRTVVFKALSL
jgi:hypothetical protein